MLLVGWHDSYDACFWVCAVLVQDQRCILGFCGGSPGAAWGTFMNSDFAAERFALRESCCVHGPVNFAVISAAADAQAAAADHLHMHCACRRLGRCRCIHSSQIQPDVRDPILDWTDVSY